MYLVTIKNRGRLVYGLVPALFYFLFIYRDSITKL
jgi:hypothetical protein